MRHLSCESILDNRDKYKQKIDIISNRMIDLEKDIEEIKMKNIFPILSSKNIKDYKINEKISKAKEKEKETKHNSKRNNYNLYFKYNDKNKFFSQNNTIRKNNSYATISREKLEYEYELRTLKKKIETLKTKNKELNENLKDLKEKNNKIEFNLNLNRNNIPDDDIILNKNKNEIILNTLNNIFYKEKLIKNIFEVIKKNDNYYNSNENAKNEEECSLLNILLNLMDIKFAYENAVLYNYFYQGIKIILLNSKKNYQNYRVENDILSYLKLLVEKEKKYKIDMKKMENLKKYYNLCKKFSSIKHLDSYLNSIIVKNMKVEQSINEIKNVLNNEKGINNKNININGMSNYINKKKILEQYIKRNKSNSNNNMDKFSFYTTDYYNNNKIPYQNYNNDKVKNYLKKNKSQSQIKISDSNSKKTKIINTNFNNYIKSKNKKYINQNRKSCSKTINNGKKPKNFNKLYSYSVSNNSKGNFNFN